MLPGKGNPLFTGEFRITVVQSTSSRMKLSNALFLLTSISAALSLSTDFPDPAVTSENISLDIAIYADNYEEWLATKGPEYEVHFHHDKLAETAAMVVTNSEFKYVAAVFSGTDGINDWISDLQVKKVPFGPPEDPINEDVLVHKGFNKVLWHGDFDNLYDDMKRAMDMQLEKNPEYEIVATGHSLGGSAAILFAAAIATEWPDKFIYCDSIGAPRTGDAAWKEWVDGMDNLAVWRHVHRKDIVPRIPTEDMFYSHPGHTVQLDDDGAAAYYLHDGDEALGYVGHPDNWNSTLSIDDHSYSEYLAYINEKSIPDPETFYVDSFESVEDDENSFSMPELSKLFQENEPLKMEKKVLRA